MKYDKEILSKAPYVSFNLIYLILSLSIPWYNSAINIYLREERKDATLAGISILIGYLLLLVIMYIAYKITPNSESFKGKIWKEFFSYHSVLKSAVIYIISIAFLSSNNQSFGTALLIPYYMFVINFYISISSEEIKKGWF